MLERKRLLQIVLICGLLFGSTGIVYGQSLTLDNDSCICYTDNQDKRALECLINKSERDSLLQNQALQILNYKSVLDKDSKIITLNNEMIKKQKNTIKMIAIKLKISKTMTLVGAPIALLGGIFIGMNLK